MDCHHCVVLFFCSQHHPLLLLHGSDMGQNTLDMFFLSFLKIYFIFRERGREKERKRNIDWFPLAHTQVGTQPANQACALTGDQTSDLLVCRMMPNPLIHTSQDKDMLFLNLYSSSRVLLYRPGS